MTSRILAIGECMVELSQTDAGLYRRSFAGDTFNAAWYLRRLLHLDAEVSYATCIGAVSYTHLTLPTICSV